MNDLSSPLLPQLLTIGDVANHLQFSERTVRRYVERGWIPATRIGRSLRFTADDLAAARIRVVPKNKDKSEGSKLGPNRAA